MTMTKFDPFALVGTTLFKDLNRLFDLAPEDTSAVRDTFRPRIDLAETDEAFVVRAELPGIDPADIDVSVEDEVLTITGTRSFDTSTESEEEGVKYRRREIFEGNFARKIRLHPDVDVEAVTAKSIDGILEVTVPKTPAAQPRKVTVSVQR